MSSSSILVVDDHPVTREPLARLLRYEGFTTTCAANGVEALDAVGAARPDLILLDVMMPKMNGIDFLRNLRADPRSRGVPVIALTGTLDPQLLTGLKDLGVTEVMTKARFTVEQLMARVRAQVATNRECSTPPPPPVDEKDKGRRPRAACELLKDARV